VPVIVYHDLFGQMRAVEKTNPQMAICSSSWRTSPGLVQFAVNSVYGGTRILFFFKPNKLGCPLEKANAHNE